MRFKAHFTDAICIGNLPKQIQLMVIRHPIRKQAVAQIGQYAPVVSLIQHTGGVFDKFFYRIFLCINKGNIQQLIVVTGHRLQLARLMVINFTIGGQHVDH